MSQPKSLLRSAGAISLATMVSRVLGLVRDQVQSFVFGAGFATDAFFVAFRIPNLLRDLFAEGALSAAFVATFTAEREQKGTEEAWRLARRTATALVVVLGAGSLLLFVLAPWAVALYTPGFEAEKQRLAAGMTRVLSPFLLLVSLAALAMGILNTHGRFFLPALAPAWFNVFTIAGILALPAALVGAGIDPVYAIAWGALAGGAAQLAFQLPALRRAGFRFRWDFAPGDPALRRVASLMLPATLGLAAVQINIFIDTSLASGLGDGPISWLQYAFRLIQLPIGVFGVALGMANLARVSRDAARGDLEGLKANLAGALRSAAVLALPAAAGLVALREPLVRLLFERGRFDPSDTAATAAAVLCYATGLYAYAATKIQVPTFYALGDTRLPVAGSAASVAGKLGASFLFLAVLPRFGVHPFLALALGTSAAAWLNFGVLAWGIRRKIGRLEGERVVSSTLVMLAVSLAMAWAVGASHEALERALPGGGVAGSVARILAAVAVGIGIALSGARLAGIAEGRAIFRAFAGFARRRPPR